MELKASPHAPVREAWLAQHVEDALEPALPIIDAHHHLWDRPSARYLFEEFLADTQTGHDIRASVFVQCRSMVRAAGPEALRPVGETEFVAGVAARSASGLYGPMRACAAIVAMADLMLGDSVAPVLEAHLQAAGGRLRGIRNTTAWHPSPEVVSNPLPPPPGMLMAPAFRQGAARLAQYGLSLDVWAYHTQLDEVLDLARAVPGVTIVLNHCGGPLGIGPHAGRRAEVLRDWGAGMRALAGCPNVVLKLGGLAMRVGGHAFDQAARPPSSGMLADAWRPVVESCIALFGADRCLFESNFPVDKGMCSYAVLWNAFKRLAAGASAAEKAALFHGTATRVYRLRELPAGIAPELPNEEHAA